MIQASRSLFLSTKMSFGGKMISVTQVLVYFVYALPCRLVNRIQRTHSERIIDLRRGSLIVANHISKEDPFVILAHIPLRTFLRITPIYFPIDPDYFRKTFLRLWLIALGGYDAGVTQKEKLRMILFTRMLLRRGETVFLFPEGKINIVKIGEFSRGIEYFAREAKSVALIKTGGMLRQSIRFFSDHRSVTFLGVRIFNESEKVFAKELRDVFIADER